MKDSNDVIYLKGIYKKLLSKWYYFIIAMLVVLALTSLYIKFSDEIYHIRATILLKGKPLDLTNSDDYLKGLEIFVSDTEVEDEIEIITSRTMIEKTISKLDFEVSYFLENDYIFTRELYDHTPFRIELDTTSEQITGVPIYISLSNDGPPRIKIEGEDPVIYHFMTKTSRKDLGAFTIDTTLTTDSTFRSSFLSFDIHYNPDFHTQGRCYFVINNPESIVEQYHNSLKVDPISRESSMAEVSIKEKVPQKQVLFINTLLDTYLEYEVFRKNQLGLKVIDFIDRQINSISDSLRLAEGSLESFRAKNKVVDIPTTSENLVNRLDLLQNERSKLEVKLKNHRYIYSQLESGEMKDFTSISSSEISDPVLGNLLLELTRLNQEKAGINYNTKGRNPIAMELDVKIRSTRRSLLENIQGIIDGTLIAINEMDQRIQEAQQAINRLPSNERELINIKRKFDFSDNVYNYLLEKKAELGIAIASNTSGKLIVDRARVVGNSPVSPNTRMIYAIGVLLGLTIPIGTIIIKDFLNENIVSKDDLLAITNIPVMGIIGHASKSERSFSVKEKSVLLEAFRTLQVNYHYLTLGKGNHVLGITSFGSKEGKTFCAINLALVMAQSGRKTVIVDVDMRRPQIAEQLQLDNEKGLSNFLIKEYNIREVIQHTNNENLDVITSGPIPPNPIDILGQPGFEDLINKLKVQYNVVILDSPPLGYVSEYIILMKYTNANIYVVRSDYTSKYSFDKINELYENKQIRNVGIILNDVRSVNFKGYAYGSYR